MKQSIDDLLSVVPLSVFDSFPCDLIEMRGHESVDFMQRMSTNDFSRFMPGTVQKTLFINEKGRIIDTAWIIHETDRLVTVVSRGMAAVIIEWLNKYIIMEDIFLKEISDDHSLSLHFSPTQNERGYSTDYFSFPVTVELRNISGGTPVSVPQHFDRWRIMNGIPFAGKEIVQDFNPLELRLRDWISFSKGCYIGQEVIARLDTYDKVQRALYRFSSAQDLRERELICDISGAEIGRVTSVTADEERNIGLAVVRTREPAKQLIVTTKSGAPELVLEPIIRKVLHGRN
jgi:folate-binding protein YgfZ